MVGNGSQDGQEISVDRYGRVRVQFHWDRQNQNSGRVRVAQNWSGKNYGMIFHPRLGQEVLVQFENGDPDRPIIIGTAHNPNQMPPYTLVNNQAKSGIKTRSSRFGSTAEANELSFQDQKGAEEIYLHAQKDYTRVVENHDVTTINQGDHVITVAEGVSTLTAAKSITLKVGDSQLVINTSGAYLNGKKIRLNSLE